MSEAHLQLMADEIERASRTSEEIPDRRLALMFACAHPAIEARMRAPLILQTILGLTAETIAAAFLIPPATMGQRLSRAKARIQRAGIPFRVPDRDELPERLDAVLEAIYAAYSEGWAEIGEDGNSPLAEEAIWLGRLVVSLLPDEPEAKGMLALMLYAEARRAARRDAAGAYVPLDEQDVALWDEGQLQTAEALLHEANSSGPSGRYQIESGHSVGPHGAAAVRARHAPRHPGSL
jgi:RNA polymerase sigma-70 factor, ECF subfamily